MKKRLLKAALAVILILCFAVSFASCGSTSPTLPDAESMDGDIDGTDIEWSYDEDDKTLTIEGTGEIPDCDAPEDVWWYAARHNIEEIEISKGITAIGDYAFYYTPELTKIEIPESVTSIGELSFAFCSSLTALELPEGLVSIGDSCFEACTSIEGIFVPSSVTELGSRAFALCSAMEEAIIMAQISELGEQTFMNCSSLDKLCFNQTVKEMSVADDAFEGASIDFEDAEFTASLTGDATLTITYEYENGETAAETYTEQLKYGESFSLPSPTIEGYKATPLTVSGIVSSFDTQITVTYVSEEAQTEAESETEEQTEEAPAEADKGTNVGNIIAIVILVVVIVAIVVLAVLMMRSDKKNNSGTRTNNSNQKKK